MNVEMNKIYMCTLSKSEFNALHKLIGNSSSNDRKKFANLSDDENDIISELYLSIDNAKGDTR